MNPKSELIERVKAFVCEIAECENVSFMVIAAEKLGADDVASFGAIKGSGDILVRSITAAASKDEGIRGLVMMSANSIVINRTLS